MSIVIFKSKIEINVIVYNSIIELRGYWGVSFLIIKKNLFNKLLNKNSLYLINMNEFILFKRKINFLIFGLTNRWIQLLEFKGYGLKSHYSKSKNIYKIDLGYSHILEYSSNDLNFLARKYKGQKFLLVAGIDKNKVNNFVYKLLRIRPYIVYKFKGFKLINEVLRLKQGKKKQFF